MPRSKANNLPYAQEVIEWRNERWTVDMAQHLLAKGMLTQDTCKSLNKLFYKIQKARVAAGNQIAAYEKKELKQEAAYYRVLVFQPLNNLEFNLDLIMKEYVLAHILWESWLKPVKGIAHKTLAVILSYIDPANFATVSKLWSFLGLGVELRTREGLKKWYATEKEAQDWVAFQTERVKNPEKKEEALKSAWKKTVFGPKSDFDLVSVGQRTRVGERANFNPWLKSKFIYLARLFVQYESPGYYDLFQKALSYYEGKGIPEKHASNRARRIVAKEFIKHLWTYWRKLLDLPVPGPHDGGDHFLTIPRPTPALS